MTNFVKIMKLDKFDYSNWALQAWSATKEQSKGNYWIHRIVSELAFLKEVSKVNSKKYDKLIEEVSTELYHQYKLNGAISKQDIIKVEEKLAIAKEDISQYEILFASHAHIDINWLWGWHETVQITIDTFRTMLDIMKENDNFIFSQSQAILYKIIEDYHPEMFEEIKERVAEKRWEITASTWVEGDKNLANGESQARQILYTKNYFKETFGLTPDDLLIGFEPDTFGHVESIPEILNDGLVKYYYHVRGNNITTAYRFISPSKKEIIVYRDPKIYTMAINGHIAKNIVEFSEKTKLNKLLAVYGVSDHGGGPTRKDIEMIEDMKTWPIYPQVKFSSYREYFEYLDNNKDLLPIEKRELNQVFNGCYTSQSRIKLANRFGENGLYDAEVANVIASISNGYPYSVKKFKEAWLNILTNQFHDILPGSGITYTREYALGKFQESMAIALTNKKLSLENLSKDIDTSMFENDLEDYYDTSFGAGVGFNSETFKVSKASRGRGPTRVYHVWNTTPYDRTEQVYLFLWNYEDDPEKIKIVNSKQEAIKFEKTLNPKIVIGGFDGVYEADIYWGHWYQTFTAEVTVKAYGYETIVLMQDDELENKFSNFLVIEDDIPRVQKEEKLILENEFVKIEFDPVSLRINSYYDKEFKEELTKLNGAGFNYIIEDGTMGMDAWVVGRTIDSEEIINSNVSLVSGVINEVLSYDAKVASSDLSVMITLPNNSKLLTYSVNVAWTELGEHKKTIKTLNYNFPLNKEITEYKYDIAFGVTSRTPSDIDASGNSFSCAVMDERGFIIATDSKYGFKGQTDSIGVSLIRSTTDPDKYPEVGDHHFKFCVGIVNDNSNSELIKTSKLLNHPLDVIMGSVKKGTLSLSNSFIRVKQPNVIVSSFKMSEDGKNDLIIRLYEADGVDTEFEIEFNKEIKYANYSNLLEQTFGEIRIKGNKLIAKVQSYCICTIRLKIK